MSAYGPALKGLMKLIGKGVQTPYTFLAGGGKPATKMPLTLNPFRGDDFITSSMITLPSMAYGMPMAYNYGVKRPLNIARRSMMGGEQAAENSITAHRNAMAEAKHAQQQALLKQAQQRNFQDNAQKKTAMLAATAPHLYNQIMAGRRLPQGATVLGGSPRTDLMEEIAYIMAKNGQQAQGTGRMGTMPGMSPNPSPQGGTSDAFLQGLRP